MKRLSLTLLEESSYKWHESYNTVRNALQDDENKLKLL